MRCREHPPTHTHLSVLVSNHGLVLQGTSSAPREKLKVPPRPPLEEHSHYKHSGQLQVFFTQLEPNSCRRQNSHVSLETNSKKRICVLGTNHTKIYRVNLVGFKHSAENPSRSPHHQNKHTLRSKRFSNVLTNHQGRFPETVPEAKQLTYRSSYKRLTLMILFPKKPRCSEHAFWLECAHVASSILQLDPEELQQTFDVELSGLRSRSGVG